MKYPSNSGCMQNERRSFWVRIIYYSHSIIAKLECGPTANVMAALPNIGGTLCSTPQSLADAHHQCAVQ